METASSGENRTPPKAGQTRVSKIRKSQKAVPPLHTSAREGAASNSASLAPLLPLSADEIRRTARLFAKQAAIRPAKLLASAVRISADQLEILRGGSPCDIPAGSRFSDPRWTEIGYYRRLQQSWLSFESQATELLAELELDALDEKRIEFLLKQLSSGLSPANFPMTNPEVVDQTRSTRGKNLIQGLGRFWQDYKDNGGLPTQVDKTLFKVGENLATTPGEVIYQNELFELIQYTPVTAEVHRTPLLLVSSFINRSYIFDLKPGRSLVENMLNAGHSVFLMIWNNPGVEHCDMGIDDYVQSIITAGEVTRAVCKTTKFNLTGICGGAQLVAIAAAVLQDQKKRWINTLTLISFVVDPHPEDTAPGALCTEQTVKLAKSRVRKHRLYKASSLNWNMNLLQPERLLWGTAVDYYLLGKDPSASEVMYWMNHQVNVSEQMYCDEIDIMLNNPIPEPGALEVLGVPIDLGRIRVDNYQLAPYYDHVMPWQSMYRNHEYFGGDTEFVVTNGGHITPCITTLDNKRAAYFTNSGRPDGAQAWLDGAAQHKGSWVVHWMDWLAKRSGSKVAAPTRHGNKKYKSLGSAPGTYVNR
jgi:polyhydroxyalkanoate synthase